VRRIPWIGESRSARGCRGGNDSIWARISGEALSRNHASPSALTATHSWVRGSIWTDPSRAPRQFRQAQFHCGQPPPAAEPSTRTFMFCSPTSRLLFKTLAAVGLGLRVHLDLVERGLDPLHGRSPFLSGPHHPVRSWRRSLPP